MSTKRKFSEHLFKDNWQSGREILLCVTKRRNTMVVRCFYGNKAKQNKLLFFLKLLDRSISQWPSNKGLFRQSIYLSERGDSSQNKKEIRNRKKKKEESALVLGTPHPSAVKGDRSRDIHGSMHHRMEVVLTARFSHFFAEQTFTGRIVHLNRFDRSTSPAPSRFPSQRVRCRPRAWHSCQIDSASRASMADALHLTRPSISKCVKGKAMTRVGHDEKNKAEPETKDLIKIGLKKNPLHKTSTDKLKVYFCVFV